MFLTMTVTPIYCGIAKHDCASISQVCVEPSLDERAIGQGIAKAIDKLRAQGIDARNGAAFQVLFN